MNGTDDATKASYTTRQRRRKRPGAGQRPWHRLVIASAWLAAVAVVTVAAFAWLGSRAVVIKYELAATAQLTPVLKESIAANRPQEASDTADQLRSHTAAARAAAEDPLWTLASAIPVIGLNFRAVTEVARSADEVAALGVMPLVKVLNSLNWDSFLSSGPGTDLLPIHETFPELSAAAQAVRVSTERLGHIDPSGLWPQVGEPLIQARQQLQTVSGALDAAAHVSEIAPAMLGTGGQRNYLLIIQNNAEARASGGIPGALAVLTLDEGKLTLGAQSSASGLGAFSPSLPVDAEQQRIYSTRLGRYMQDVNLTPDFPTAAGTAQGMWERKTGQRLDGVISMDPVVLSYVLHATGPVKITDPKLIELASGKLPTELNAKNVVPTLLSNVYAKIREPQLQDIYFAGVAREIFSALSSGQGETQALIKALARGTSEGRVLLWSAADPEQAVIAKYPLSGAIAGSSVSPAQFGVYFNDGTGAKMDYYVKRTVQLVEECTGTASGRVKVRVTSTNAAPADAATSLPAYVTGRGLFGVPAGTVQTNVIAYGPVQANMETVSVDGAKTDFAAHRHANRPVGMVTVSLAPGQSSTVELTFDKIVQHTEPDLVVTPTVQPVKDVILSSQSAECNVEK